MPQIDLGQVVGAQGPQGIQGPQGAQGIQGPAGPAATINGVNALTIEAGANIDLAQEGGTATLSVPTDTVPTADSTKPVQSGGVLAALNNKAPAGYGLGANGSAIPGNDLNNAILGGFYVFSLSVQNIPRFQSGKVLVMPYSNLQYYTQIAFSALTSEIAFRFCNNGVWGPWEYLNPLLSPGVEYRTAERYNGKPVYAQLVNAGVFPENGPKAVSHGISDIDKIVSANGNLDTVSSLPYVYGSARQDFMVTTTEIYLTSISPAYISVNAYITIKYTKTTD